MLHLFLALALWGSAQGKETVIITQKASQLGIYPVYDVDKHWYLLDRYPGQLKKRLRQSKKFLVIGSNAADLFTVARAGNLNSAACFKKRPVSTPGYLLKGPVKRVGTPIIAVYIQHGGGAINPRRARFYHLDNQVNEDVYKTLGPVIKEAAAAEIKSGEFALNPDDEQGRQMAQNPTPEQIQMKLDFGFAVHLAGGKQGFVLVDGIQFSKTFRRCLRLFVDNKPVGRCTPMPNSLMTETNLLEFVAYDANNTGFPFILAYTPKEPLWGHERWAFQIMKTGTRLFLMDALDPKCRDKI